MTKVKMKTRTVVMTEVEYLFLSEAIGGYTKHKALMGKIGAYRGKESNDMIHKLSVLVGLMEKLDEVFEAERTPMGEEMKKMVDKVRGVQVMMAGDGSGKIEPN